MPGRLDGRDSPVGRKTDMAKEVGITVAQEDGMYRAHVDELPGCFASGATVDELLKAVSEATSMYVSNGGAEVQVGNNEPPAAGPAAARRSRPRTTSSG